jgi:nitroreductase
VSNPSVPRSPREIVRPLLKARQVREFTDQPLSDDTLDALTEVARWSGSSRNEQPWRFVVVRDVPTIRKLWQAGVPQTRSMETAMAGIAIVLPADPSRLVSDAYDDGRVAERILIAANMLDLGAAITWIRSDVLASVRSILGLPGDWMVRTIVALGHPTTAARLPRAPKGTARMAKAELVDEERWSGPPGG